MTLPSKPRPRGFILIAMSISMFLILAVMGLAFDFGRIYIAKSEAQIFTDAAALTAAMKLNGTPAGITEARAAVSRVPIRWNLGTQEFTGIAIEFSPDGATWEKDPKDAVSQKFARVTAPSNTVEIAFLRAVGGPNTFTVPAHSVATTNPVRLTE